MLWNSEIISMRILEALLDRLLRPDSFWGVPAFRHFLAHNGEKTAMLSNNDVIRPGKTP
jgi:hypothetical protein